MATFMGLLNDPTSTVVHVPVLIVHLIAVMEATSVANGMVSSGNTNGTRTE